MQKNAHYLLYFNFDIRKHIIKHNKNQVKLNLLEELNLAKYMLTYMVCSLSIAQVY